MPENQEITLPATITDLLGTKAISETIKDTASDARGFLGHICTPAAQELGLLFQDKVRAWRANNALKTLKKSESLYKKLGYTDEHAHPRLIHTALENSSWTDDDLVQSLWAGLITSSCTPTGQDDYNLLFMNILSSITVSQAKIIQYIGENSSKAITKAGWIASKNELEIPLDELYEIAGTKDFHRVDFELDHLRTIELINPYIGGFQPETTVANLTPTGLGLQFYVRCQGYTGSPIDYFGLPKD
jgi:hypothetical protein